MEIVKIKLDFFRRVAQLDLGLLLLYGSPVSFPAKDEDAMERG
jgi:hypothetical protein